MTGTDGLDALAKVTEHRVKLAAIITDFHMPRMDGPAFVQALRRILPDLPVLVASGLMEESTALKFQSLGVALRLDKLFSEVQLADVMLKLLSGKMQGGSS